mgnify:CR=1 FL=1
MHGFFHHSTRLWVNYSPHQLISQSQKVTHYKKILRNFSTSFLTHTPQQNQTNECTSVMWWSMSGKVMSVLRSKNITTAFSQLKNLEKRRKPTRHHSQTITAWSESQKPCLITLKVYLGRSQAESHFFPPDLVDIIDCQTWRLELPNQFKSKSCRIMPQLFTQQI